MKPEIDPIKLEVIKNALDSIGDETALTLMRSSYSGIVRDALDFSTALCDQDGLTLAQGVTTPLHLGSFPDVMTAVLDKYVSRIHPGDVFILNDPYGSGGIHLPDIFVIKPVFFDHEHIAFVCTVAHHTDVGGIAAGSNSIHSIEIFQEGLCIPALKLYDRGEVNESIMAIISKNVRVPMLVLGDIRAQLSACVAGERAYLKLVERYGDSTLLDYQNELMDYTERAIRSEIAAIPKGEYEFTDHIDGLGEDPKPITFHVKLKVDKDSLSADFEGTSPQVKAGINSPFPFTKSAVYAAVRSVMGADIPNNAGYFRPITIKAPLGTVVNPRPLAPCAVRGITGFRICDTVFGALAQAIPDRVPAAGEGGNSIISIGGYHHGEPFVYVEAMTGTWGGRPTQDGADGAPNPAANQANQPVELMEADLLLRVERYGYVPNSGGAGKYRGGLAQVREWRILADEAVITVRSDKRRFPPYGLAGGKAGAPSSNMINPGSGDERRLPVLPMESIQLKHGDLFQHVMAGGGGWGDPLERDPARVLEDVLEEKLTVDYVMHECGVVIDVDRRSVDIVATAQLRETMRAHRVMRPE